MCSQTDRGRVPALLKICRKFPGRYLCTFYPSFAMDSRCCFPSHIILGELMDRWRLGNNGSLCYWTMKYFSLERNHSVTGRRRKDMNLLLPYAPSEWPAALPAGGRTSQCFWDIKAMQASIICFRAAWSFQSYSENKNLNFRTGKGWEHSSCSMQTDLTVVLGQTVPCRARVAARCTYGAAQPLLLSNYSLAT